MMGLFSEKFIEENKIETGILSPKRYYVFVDSSEEPSTIQESFYISFNSIEEANEKLIKTLPREGSVTVLDTFTGDYYCVNALNNFFTLTEKALSEKAEDK